MITEKYIRICMMIYNQWKIKYKFTLHLNGETLCSDDTVFINKTK